MRNSSIFQRLFSLEGEAALVTGASGGLGRALAIGLAEAGATVGLNGVSATKLEETLACIEQAGGRGVLLPATLNDVNESRNLIGRAHSALGRLDILVNCAGINRRKRIEAVTPNDFDTLVAVNLRGAFFLSQAAYPIMRAQGGGKILNIGSMSSLAGFATVSVYGMTKSALAQVTKTMAVEWAKDNIQVNCIAPGYMRTPLTEEHFWKHPYRRGWLLDRIPARRAGEPEDLIAAAVWLCSSGSGYVTGQTIAIDGGFTAGGSWEPPQEG
jgi:NAD(P)-dependent dehydrogenase (short-subunit alcohol dehydrogenase family)